MRRLLVLVSLFIVPGVIFAADDSHPRSLDPELQIELFAEHPTIVTPTGIDVDYKGRVFAVESNTHFRPKDYQRHPSDRVLILQDTNGDGKADKTTVFTDGLTHTMSVKVKPLWLNVSSKPTTPSSDRRRSRRLGLSAYIATRSAIWHYHDDDGDLQADRRERIIKLDTKGNYPHNGLAGIAFDAMGWMYFGFGENLGAKYTIIGSDGTTLSGGGEGGNLYRCRPDGSKLKQWATGFWNPHASCVDAFGRLFTVDNDPDSRPPCRLLHIIEGGDYGFRFRNGRKGLHPFTAWNGEIPGTLPMVSGTGEAPSGIVAYESDGFPEKYIGHLLVGSWGDHRIDRFVLKPKGASFVSRPETFIKGGEDFRPVGLAVAPDGSLFCTDWVKRDYKLHGHGRVWRISRKHKTSRDRKGAGKTNRNPKRVDPARKNPLPDGRGSSKKPVLDISTITPKRPVKELTALLSHPRLDVRRMAAVSLARKDFVTLEKLSSTLKNQRATFEAVCAFWRFLPPNENEDLRELLNKQEPKTTAAQERERRWKHLQKNDDPFLFHLVVNNWIRNHPPSEDTLLEDYKYYRNTEAGSEKPRRSSDRVRVAAVLVGRALHRKSQRLVKRLLTDPSPDVRRVAVQWVAEENLTELKPQVQAVLNGKVMNAGLFLATLAALEMLDGKSPKEFDKTSAGKYVLPLLKDSKRPALVRAYALRLADPDEPSLDDKLFRELLASDNATLKAEAVRTLRHSRHSFAGNLLLDVASDEKVPASLRADAVAGLYGRWFNNPDGPKMMQAVLKLVSAKGPAVQIEALRSSRPLLTKTAPGGAVRLKLLRQIETALKQNPKLFETDSTLRRMAEQLELAYREADRPVPAVLNSIRDLRPKSPAEWYASAEKKSGGDVEAGRRIFFHSNSAGCYKCHTVNGRGGTIGPDLTFIARTMNRRKLAESILEPSQEIAPQFTLWSFVMADGKVHHGVVLGDTRNNKQRIGTPEGEVLTLPANAIELRKPRKKSVMPEELIDRLTATEFRDLLAFLETLK